MGTSKSQIKRLSHQLGIPLLNCPFCGGQPRIMIDEDNHGIYCNQCPAGVEDFSLDSKALLEAWNLRKNVKKETKSWDGNGSTN